MERIVLNMLGSSRAPFANNSSIFCKSKHHRNSSATSIAMALQLHIKLFGCININAKEIEQHENQETLRWELLLRTIGCADNIICIRLNKVSTEQYNARGNCLFTCNFITNILQLLLPPIPHLLY